MISNNNLRTTFIPEHHALLTVSRRFLVLQRCCLTLGTLLGEAGDHRIGHRWPQVG